MLETMTNGGENRSIRRPRTAQSLPALNQRRLEPIRSPAGRDIRIRMNFHVRGCAGSEITGMICDQDAGCRLTGSLH